MKRVTITNQRTLHLLRRIGDEWGESSTRVVDRLAERESLRMSESPNSTPGPDDGSTDAA